MRGEASLSARLWRRGLLLLVLASMLPAACVDTTSAPSAPGPDQATTVGQGAGGGIGGSGNVADGGGIGGSGINNDPGGGIGGSGIFSVGRITGFGSVFVDGVEFFTGPQTRIVVEGRAASEGELALGMVVTVHGRADAGVVNAREIRFEDAIEGPVAEQPVPDADDLQRSFSILGQRVVVDRWRTIFAGLSYEALAAGDVVEISGFADAQGVLQASRVELKSRFEAGVSPVEVKGVISHLSSDGLSFRLGALQVDASSADLTALPAGLVNGIYVEVRGTLGALTADVLKATVVREETIHRGEDGDEVLVEGLITRFVSNEDFDVNGQAVNAAPAELSPPTVTLALNTKVKVEGRLVNGVVEAKKVKVRKVNVAVFAEVSGVDAARGVFRLRPRQGEAEIPVQVHSGTQMNDEVNGMAPYGVADLRIGDFLLVAAVDTGAGVPISAIQVDHVVPKEVLLEGLVSRVDESAITVLGVSYPLSPAVTFRDAAGRNIDKAAFLATVIAEQSVVRIIDKRIADGIADRIEIKSP